MLMLSPSNAKVQRPAPPVRCNRLLDEDQLYAILLFSTTCAVDFDDLDQPVKDRRPDSSPSPLQILADHRSVGGMATGQASLELPHGLGTPEPLSGERRVDPAQDEATIRRPESPAQDVIEGIEIAPHSTPGIRTRLTTS